MEEKQEEPKKNRWDWLPEFMPGVVAVLADKRAEVGADWVNTCWKHGVVDREPGWFFAAQGALTVGVPANAELLADYYAMQAKFPDTALVILRPKDGGAA